MQRWTAILMLALVGGFSGACAAAIPNPEVLIKNYPVGSDAEVIAAIGGEVHANKVKTINVGAIRMSRAFNYSGAPIPVGPGANVRGLHTVKGADKRNYAYSAGELKTWLVSKYGQPTLQFKTGPYGKAPQALAGRKGIIVFVDAGWSDAGAQVDLWDGQRVVGKDMFELAKQVYLWDSGPPKVQFNQGKVSKATLVRAGPSSSAKVLGTLPVGTVVKIEGAPVTNYYRIGNGQFVFAPDVKLQ